MFPSVISLCFGSPKEALCHSASQSLTYGLFLSVNCCCSLNLKNSEVWAILFFRHLYCSHCFHDVKSFFFIHISFFGRTSCKPLFPQSLLQLLLFLLDQICFLFSMEYARVMTSLCLFSRSLTMLSSQLTALPMQVQNL